jgi:hypothetical protein
MIGLRYTVQERQAAKIWHHANASLGATLQRITMARKNIYLLGTGKLNMDSVLLPAHLLAQVTKPGDGRERQYQNPLPLELGLKGCCSPEWPFRFLDCFGVEYGEPPSWKDEESPWTRGRPVASESRE